MSKQASIFSFFNKSTPIKPKEEDKQFKIKGIPVEELQIFWAKVEGHPWWPGLVCLPPNGSSFIRGKLVHIQFFDDPPSRGWVRENLLKPFGEPMKVGIPTCKNSEWKTAQARAGVAFSQEIEKRRELLVEHQESDEEMEEDETDGNSSKENIDDSETINSPEVSAKKRNKSGDDSSEGPTKKKRKIVLASDVEDSEEEFKPNESCSSEDDVSSGEGEKEISDQSSESCSPSPVKKVTQKKFATPKTAKKALMTPKATPQRSFGTPYTPSAPPFSPYSPSMPSPSSPAVRSKLSLFAASEAVSDGNESTPSFPFMHPDKIKDREGRSPSNPDYDRRTLHVPDSFLSQQTPGHRQWWDFKSRHFDTVLFFKMGKFYELFYMDADIGVQELGLLMMRGNVPHSGFPEISYGRYSSSLLEKGYKVARIEQTETPDMMEKRCKSMRKCTKFDRVVRREVCQLTTPATRVYGVQDSDPTSPQTNYLLAFSHKKIEDGDNCVCYGVCFIDTSLGSFHLGQFTDDRHSSRLRTLLAHYPPAQVLVERHQLSSSLKSLFSRYVSDGLVETLVPETEFWSGEKCLKYLAEEDFFKVNGDLKWPEKLAPFIDTGSFSPQENCDLSLSCLGAVTWYLKQCFLHHQLLTAQQFEEYLPPDKVCDGETVGKLRFNQRTMVIDGNTANNLELLCNDSDGGVQGTLFSVLDHTVTPMGKRLLQQWLLTPLMDKHSINNRLNAIEDLKSNASQMEEITCVLKQLPDMERLLARIHGQGLKKNLDDPNSRAILFEEQQFGKKRVMRFLSAIQSFKAVTVISDIFKVTELSSGLLKSIVLGELDGGKFPDMREILQFFDNSFCHERAKKEGKIIPSSGVDKEYDDALEAIEETKKSLEENLKNECRHFGCKVSYFGSDKKRYQLEVPESAVKRADGTYELASQRKGFKRFYSPRCKELLAEMIVAEELREAALKDIARRIFQQFDDKKSIWSVAVDCVKTLDVLLSLTNYSNSVETVRPEILDLTETSEPSLEIRRGVHPTMSLHQGDVIDNDVVMGASEHEGTHAPLVIVTGPNMGGKSTLMRQTALLIVLAQMGSYVPCEKMKFSPVDRIFTRVGASDRMLAGESTFLVELKEAAAILQHASSHALVLVDELGRGTATHDGTAVAWGVAGALARIGCRTLFSTHYHGLVQHFTNTDGVSLGHMSCMVEEDALGEETITFLYKFSPGVCPKSYGFNAARLADVPHEVVQKARGAAKLMEGHSDALSAFKGLLGPSSIEEKKDIIGSLAGILEAVAI